MTQRTFGRALGELIFQKRMAAGLSQLQLSEDAFGSAAKTRRISELETGSVAQPHLKTINPIINALGITDAEIEACAKQAVEAIDPDLDRALREARNLLDALAAQFEHARPDATLAELDDFLRAKAREWRSLRDRISEIEGLDEIIAALKAEAAEALANGEFERVDEVLAQAEQQHQESRTLKEVRSQALIRISRGDAALLGEKLDVALQHYNAAVQFFAPFDEHEMVVVAQQLAARVYEDSRRSLNPTFSVASGVLVSVWKTQTVEQDVGKVDRVLDRKAVRRPCMIRSVEYALVAVTKALDRRAVAESCPGQGFLKCARVLHLVEEHDREPGAYGLCDAGDVSECALSEAAHEWVGHQAATREKIELWQSPQRGSASTAICPVPVGKRRPAMSGPHQSSPIHRLAVAR